MYTYVCTEMNFSGVQLNKNLLKFRHYSASGTTIILTFHNVFFEMSMKLRGVFNNLSTWVRKKQPVTNIYFLFFNVVP